MICRIKKRTAEEIKQQNTDAGTELDGKHRKKTDRGTNQERLAQNKRE